MGHTDKTINTDYLANHLHDPETSYCHSRNIVFKSTGTMGSVVDNVQTMCVCVDNVWMIGCMRTTRD